MFFAFKQSYRRAMATLFAALLAPVCGLPLCSGQAPAQNAAGAAKFDSSIEPQARALFDRLSALRELPDGAWKTHSGDLANGEAVDLDQTSWQPIAVSSSASKEAVWFRQTYRLPAALDGYDLAGARIWFQFHASANGPMPEILYFNGRRVAMGDDLEPVVLFDQAPAGAKATVAVKLLHTVDLKTIKGATLRVEFAKDRPNPQDLLQELLSAADFISWPPANIDDGNRGVLFDAIRTVDLNALDAHDQPRFDESLKAAHAKLEMLLPLVRQLTFHLTGNSHIDAAWLWPWTETVDVVKRTFSTALQLMYEYPGYTYTQSAAAYNAWMAEKYPEMNAEIARRIQEGRWEIVGGMWVEPDLNMPDGESLVRQLLVGKRWYRQAYGVDVRIGWNPDSFGYTWQLPQIYKKSGVDYFVTQKMAWNDTNQLPFKLFWWESPDGSKVLAYFPHDYGNTDLSPARLSDDLATARQRAPGMTEMMDLYGVGDHGGGPTRSVLDEGLHWTGPGNVTPKYEFGTAQQFFSAIEKQIAPPSTEWNYQSIAKGYTPPAPVEGKTAIPTWKSELYFEYHRGVMTTQANHKRNMREAEVEMLDAEKWASMAWLDGKPYPGPELTEDWKKVLFNQFHDLAAGSGIGAIYKDAQKDYDAVRLSTDEIRAAALGHLADRVNTSTAKPKAHGIPVVVFNPLGTKRSGWIQVKIPFPEGARSVVAVDAALPRDSHPAPALEARVISRDAKEGTADVSVLVRDVPPMGFRTIRLHPETRAQEPVWPDVWDDGKGGLDLTYGSFRLTVNKTTGCITSLLTQDLQSWESIAPGACGNRLEFFNDTPKDYDAWNIDPGTLDQDPSVIDKADSVEPAVDGNGLGAIRVTRHWRSSKFVQTISIVPGSRLIDIDNEIDWHESHVLLKAAFPLGASGPFATYEIPYGTIDRPTTRDNLWEKAQFEVPAMRWADLSGPGLKGRVRGLSVINNSKYGYDAAGNVLRLTLLRSPKWPDPEADMGYHHFHFALYPHVGTWRDALTVRRGYEYNYPLTALVTTPHAGSLPAERSFASVSPENVVLTAVKKAEDANGLIFRVYEWAGKDATAEFHVPPGAARATVTNLMETPEGSPLKLTGDLVKVPIHPFEILTIRVDYPSAGSKP